MKLTDYFNNFLTETVNLGQFRLDTLESRAASIYAALKADADLGSRIITKLPQGSWAQRTIISPQNGKAFDADFMLQMKENPAWENDPKQYSNAVYRAIDNHPIYKTMPHGRKCRCVYVEYAENKMHVDIVPYVILANGRQVIVNRDDNTWETTNPSGFTTWMRDKDKVANGNLRKVIRLLKFLRDHKNSFTGTRSILLTTLLGEQVSEWKKLGDPGYYSDLPTALLHLISDLDSWLQDRPTKPSISDPSGSGVTFDHRWSQETYAYFRDRIHVHAEEIRDAYHEPDKKISITKWQNLFGDKFVAPKAATPSRRFTEIGTGAAGAESGSASSSGRTGRAG